MNVFKIYKSLPKKISDSNIPEIALVGKSNVGKSSFINMISNSNKLARTSQKPGKTQLLNYYSYKNIYYIVDTPGYGYHSNGKNKTNVFSEMMEDFFTNNKNLKYVFIFFDIRREISEDDIDMMKYLKRINIPYGCIFNKIDKLKKNDFVYKKNKIANNKIFLDSEIFFTSFSKKTNTSETRNFVLNLLEK